MPTDLFGNPITTSTPTASAKSGGGITIKDSDDTFPEAQLGLTQSTAGITLDANGNITVTNLSPITCFGFRNNHKRRQIVFTVLAGVLQITDGNGRNFTQVTTAGPITFEGNSNWRIIGYEGNATVQIGEIFFK